jgi:outer membrane lipopolysaccharide assembly protein LptE/RlpB
MAGLKACTTSGAQRQPGCALGLIARLSLLVLALGLAAPLSGCGYSLAGRGSFLPEYIRTVGIPLFDNLSSLPDVDRILTERVRNEFINRGRYKVVTDRTGVDAVLAGAVTSVSFAPAAFTPQQQASRYALVLTASIEFTDLREKRVLWQNPAIQFREEFEIASATATSGDVNVFFGQNQDALQRVSTEFARTIVSAILEAF